MSLTTINRNHRDGQEEPEVFPELSQKVLIGSIVTYKEVAEAALPRLPAGFFFGSMYQKAWQIGLDLHGQRQPFDEWLLTEKLGGLSPQRLQAAAAFFGDATAYASRDLGIIEHHVHRVEEAHAERETRTFVERLAKDAANGGTMPHELIDRMAQYAEKQRAVGVTARYEV